MHEQTIRTSIFRIIGRRTLRRIVAGLAAAMVAAAARGDVSEAELEAVLDHVRGATGFARLAQLDDGLLLTGEKRLYGTEGTYRMLFGPDGRFVAETKARLSSTFGFDGQEAWSVDWSGLPSSLQLEDSEMALAPAWVFTGQWLADPGPFAMKVNTEKTDERSVALDMRLSDGALTWQLTIDRRTWLPASLSVASNEGSDTWKYTDYRDFKGVRVPCRVDRAGDSGEADTVRITDIATPASSTRDPYARPTKRPHNVRFNESVPAELEVKVTPTGHMLVHPRVSGRDVGWFIFDTGAGAMVITPTVADAIDMPAFGEVTASGVGGPVQTRFRQGESFTLGRVTIDRPVYIELDLSFLTPHFGVEVAGICGYDLLARVVAEFDPFERKIALLDPKSYVLAQADWQELFMNERRPHVRARFEGEREGVFLLDTGTANTVVFRAAAVKRLGLLESRQTTPSTRGGAGGVKSVRSGTIEWFELAGYRFEQPVVAFGLPDQGATSGCRSLGTIGLEFLAPFVVVLNYPDKKIGFVKRL